MDSLDPVPPPVANSPTTNNRTAQRRQRYGQLQGNNAHRPNGRPRHRRTTGLNRNNIRSREGFFMHYLFVTLSVRYASYFKPTVRRMIEFFTLIKALMMLTLLIYVHITFVKESGDCLSHVEDFWPKNGVIKVQVEANTSLPPYQYFFARTNPENWAASFEANPYQAIFKYSIKLGKDGIPRLTKSPPTTPNNVIQRARQAFGLKDWGHCPVFNLSYFIKQEAEDMLIKKFSEVAPEIHFIHPENKEDVPHWILIDPSVSDTVAEVRMLQTQEVAGFNVGPQPIRDYYAIEYSTEFGYLRLSAVTRHKLGIPVLVVTLDPTRDSCFGKGGKKWMLETFFGYDDLVMSSIKKLAEKDNKQTGGYLRNLVTGEHYKFITLWVSHFSYILAFAVMLVFTLVVTMLLRYSYHQIFVFMVELLHILDTEATPVFPAAPMLTIILALVGTEEIMTEFFHDSTLAFYVILSIWIADQFDAICMHTFISRRHWVRFFFLYHFAFYAYHYRFNGQFSELALFTSWLFIQHSMFYFLHHYEIPAIQRQIRLRQILIQGNTIANPPSQPPSGGDNQSGNDTNEPSNSDTNNDSPSPDSNDTQGGENPNPPENPTSPQDPENDVGSTEDQQTDNLSPVSLDLPEFSEPHSTQDDLRFFDHDLVKEETTDALWDDFTPIMQPDDYVETHVTGHMSVFSKYCNLIFMLFFAVLSLILIFSLAILVLNQGRFGARFPGDDFEKVAGIVR